MTTSPWYKDLGRSAFPGSAPNTGGEFGSSLVSSRKLRAVLHGMTILGAAALALYLELHPLSKTAHGLRLESAVHGFSVWRLGLIPCGLVCSLFAVSGQLDQFGPARNGNVLRQLARITWDCAISVALVICSFYIADAENLLSLHFVLDFLGLVAIGFSLRWSIDRLITSKSISDHRNVLIIGTDATATAFRNNLKRAAHLGYVFKGFVKPSDSGSDSTTVSDVVGTIDDLPKHVRKHFVDEVFVTPSCGNETVANAIDQARALGVGLRIVPNTRHGLAWRSSIQYVAGLPTILLHRCQNQERAPLARRLFGITFSFLVVLLSSPLLIAIAIAIKLDSPGPVFYLSDRVGKRGRVFRCVKFRTMVQNAEELRDQLLHRNERDAVLFKVADDPRVTRLGRFLRKYSLDEIPQFFNVLRGEMTVVGPRPALVDEVQRYEMQHLRRLDVMPGITGLWQIQGRQDPSFTTYFALDMAYIKSSSLLLDLKIIWRTVGVVLSGTGS